MGSEASEHGAFLMGTAEGIQQPKATPAKTRQRAEQWVAWSLSS